MNNAGLKGVRSVCVFCGSASGNDPAYVKAAQSCGELLAGNGISLVYGGGKVGLMGAVANAALEAGGRVVGVMPKNLVEREIAHNGLTEFHAVSSMHERKTRMSEMADAFMVLPGGAGTLEEAFEQWTWAQIGIHSKPIGFLNTKAYFSPLVSMIKGMVGTGFLNPRYQESLIIAEDPELILERFGAYIPPERKSYENAHGGN